jgi:hypothetical protein
MSKRFVSVLLMACFTAAVYAQPDVTLPSLRRVYQSSYINPAFVPRYKVSVGLPVLSGFYLNNTRSGFTVRDIIDSKDSEGLIDLNKFHSRINGKSIGVNTLNQIDLLHVGFAVGKLHVGFNSALKTQSSQAFSKDFIGFLVNGNSYFKGKTASFDGIELYNMSYLENGLLLARKFNRLSVGVRAKYLQGIAVTTTNNLRFAVTVPENSYDPMTVSVGGEVNTAGIPLLTDSVTGKPANDDDREFQPDNLLKFQNSGFAVDLGIAYEVLPNLQVYASVTDWGGINWKSTPYNYKLNNADVTFGGFSYDHLDNPSQRSDYTDSLVDLLKQSTISDKGFRTALRTRYFLGADYDLTLRDRVGFLIQGQQNPASFDKAYTISYTRKVGSNWDLTANYSIFNNTYANVGFGTAVKFGAFQFYLVQDDILIYLRPQYAQTLYLRFGFNLVWGELEGKSISKGE